MTAPINPVPLHNTAQYITPDGLAFYSNFQNLPKPLKGIDTTVIHIATNGNITQLAGPNAGAEGVYLFQVLSGEQHIPFTQVISESAFQHGATIQRTNYDKRMISARFAIVGASTYQYQLADNRWWDGQDETADGWMGIYTRYGGWRFIPVRPFQTVNTTQQLDPTAYGNNAAIWDITWIAQRPYYTKPSLFGTWSATGATKNKDGYYYGSVILANQADLPSYVQYLIDGAGLCKVQDNNSNTMVTLPKILPTDGPCLVDTNPEERTLTAANDAFDTAFYQLLQAKNVLNFFLTGSSTSGKHWWQRGYVRFVYTVPPKSVAQFNIAHSNPNASITVILQQRYKRSR